MAAVLRLRLLRLGVRLCGRGCCWVVGGPGRLHWLLELGGTVDPPMHRLYGLGLVERGKAPCCRFCGVANGVCIRWLP